MNIQAVALIGTILVGLFGYLFTYWYSLHISRRQQRLELITQRINKFYGPLYILVKTLDTAYKTQVKKFGREQIFNPGKKLTQKEWRENYAWVMSVYAPMEDELSDIILHNAHLVQEKEMPEPLLKLVAHVSVAKALLHQWKENDFSEKFPAIALPYDEVIEYASSSYERLKAEQIKIIGQPK